VVNRKASQIPLTIEPLVSLFSGREVGVDLLLSEGDRNFLRLLLGCRYFLGDGSLLSEVYGIVESQCALIEVKINKGI